ncbi:hypothetical protein L1887_43579 [Cichorium endivia]|nr:hypothetical protein L1887_43579 [Cichorium endivia]
MVSAQTRAWLLFPGRIISIFLILIENHPLKLIALPDLGNPALKGKCMPRSGMETPAGAEPGDSATLDTSYNIPLKAMVFRPSGPGRRRFSRGQRAAVRPLHAKAFYVIHRVAEDKDLLWNVMNREIKKVK